MKYYELTRNIFAPGVAEADIGWRKTKEEWMALYPALPDQAFGVFGIFKERNDRDPEVEICTEIVADLMQLDHSSSSRSMSSLLNELKRQETEATDVAKAYGLRVAGDLVREHLERHQDPTREQIATLIRIRWAQAHG